MSRQSILVSRRLLVVGFHRREWGLGRDAHSILRAFAGDWDCHLLGAIHDGPRFEEGGVTVHPSRQDFSYGATSLAALVRELRPEVVVLVNDLPLIPSYLAALHEVDVQPRVLALVPVDGDLVATTVLDGLDALELLVVPTEGGAGQLRRASSPLPPLAVVPHEVSSDVFFPLPGNEVERRRRARAELWPERVDALDGFLVFNGNTDTPRKRLETTVWAFAEFARTRPRAFLYLHHLRRDSRLHRLARSLGIGDRLLSRPWAELPCRDEDLNLIYNACDVGVNTSLGEGWGLVSVEHAATGAAQIVPRHSAPAEIWHGAAECVHTDRAIVGPHCFQWRTSEPSSYVRALMRLHDDEEYRQSTALVCAARARQWAWTPAAVHARWRGLIEDCNSAGEGLRPGRQQQTIEERMNDDAAR